MVRGLPWRPCGCFLILFLNSCCRRGELPQAHDCQVTVNTTYTGPYSYTHSKLNRAPSGGNGAITSRTTIAPLVIKRNVYVSRCVSRVFGCRNRAATESLICSVSSSSPLSSSLIQRFLLRLLLAVISVSIIFHILFSCCCLFILITMWENAQKKLPAFTWNHRVKPHFTVWHLQVRQMSKSIQ